MATKTYFTTSTYYTTLIDKSRTLTRTRTKVKSSIVTETYSGGQFGEYETDTKPKPTILVPGPNQVKYLSLGPNIYGKIKTLFATYTYFTTDVLGSVAKSMEVITQVSTSLFSTSRLPGNVQLQTEATKNVQLGADELQSLKESYLDKNKQSASSAPSIEPSQGDEGIIATKPGPAGILWDKPYLSSLKESFEASLEAASASNGAPEPPTDINLPENGPSGILRPPSPEEIKPSKPVEADTDEALVAPDASQVKDEIKWIVNRIKTI